MGRSRINFSLTNGGGIDMRNNPVTLLAMLLDALFAMSVVAKPVASCAMSSLKDRTDIFGDIRIAYGPLDCDSGSVLVDGAELVSFDAAGTVDWKPSSAGFHSITHIAGANEWTLPLIVPATAVMSSLSNETEVAGSMRIDYSPLDVGSVSVSVDGAVLASATRAGYFYWTPQIIGPHTLTCAVGTRVRKRRGHGTRINKDGKYLP